MKAKKTCSVICAGCGGDATKGSLKFPLCSKCYKENFGRSYTKYNQFVNEKLYGGKYFTELPSKQSKVKN